MGCGCRNKAKANRQVRSVVKAPNTGVLRNVHKPNLNKNNPAKPVQDQKRAIEKTRREAMLRALAKPQ